MFCLRSKKDIGHMHRNAQCPHSVSETQDTHCLYDDTTTPGDDSETFANIVDGRVSFSMEPTTQTSPTLMAFNAVDTGVGKYS